MTVDGTHNRSQNVHRNTLPIHIAISDVSLFVERPPMICCIAKTRYLWIVSAILFLASPLLAQSDENKLTADSLVQAGVPQGEIKGPFQWKSEIFPGTVRDY